MCHLVVVDVHCGYSWIHYFTSPPSHYRGITAVITSIDTSNICISYSLNLACPHILYTQTQTHTEMLGLGPNSAKGQLSLLQTIYIINIMQLNHNYPLQVSVGMLCNVSISEWDIKTAKCILMQLEGREQTGLQCEVAAGKEPSCEARFSVCVCVCIPTSCRTVYYCFQISESYSQNILRLKVAHKWPS